MKYDEITEIVKECMSKNGIEITKSNQVIDSLSCISTIVDIEEELGIVFPDDLLSIELFSDFNELIEIVYTLINDIKEWMSNFLI